MGTTMMMAMGSSLLSSYSQHKALAAHGRANIKTARSMITSMNYNLQNLEQQRRDIFEATIEELEKTQIQGRRLTAAVDAAISEGLSGGGRTAALLSRAGDADTHRALASVKSNYQKRSNEIDLSKEAAVLNTKAQIHSIRETQKPSLLGTLVSLGSAYVGARQQMEQAKLLRKMAGVLDKNSPVHKAGGVHLTWSVADQIYKSSYQPFSFSSLLGSIDQRQQKFTFDVPNPFSQGHQTINYF